VTDRDQVHRQIVAILAGQPVRPGRGRADGVKVIGITGDDLPAAFTRA
jgi:hypothetical protein